jgi:steroid delta-isomerase-like uncharacterized protein
MSAFLFHSFKRLCVSKRLFVKITKEIRVKARLVYAVLLASSLVAPVFAAPDPQQTIEQNKAVARKLFEVALNHQDWETYNQLHSKDFVAHQEKYSGNLAEDLQSAKNWRLSFPDLKYTVDREIAEGDFVAVQYTFRGTNTGPWRGFPATAKPVERSGVVIFQIVEGKIVQEWVAYDGLTIYRQLGLTPPS